MTYEDYDWAHLTIWLYHTERSRIDTYVTRSRKPLSIRCTNYGGVGDDRDAFYYLRAPAIPEEAIALRLDSDRTTLTVSIDLGIYPSLILTESGTPAPPKPFTRDMLIDKFAPEVTANRGRRTSSRTHYDSRIFDGSAWTITYPNPGFRVGDTCEVAAASMGDHLLLSDRTTATVCAENAPTVSTDG
jgi:hypothetical protein